jgi:large subunit ribosomal protein L21
MYAIIRDGGRQYKVEPGQVLEVDLREQTEGTIQFQDVLAIGDDSGLRFGSPTLSGASVSAEILGPTKGDKIFIVKMRRRKTYRRRTGHRQGYLQVKIGSISG